MSHMLSLVSWSQSDASAVVRGWLCTVGCDRWAIGAGDAVDATGRGDAAAVGGLDDLADVFLVHAMGAFGDEVDVHARDVDGGAAGFAEDGAAVEEGFFGGEPGGDGGHRCHGF